MERSSARMSSTTTIFSTHLRSALDPAHLLLLATTGLALTRLVARIVSTNRDENALRKRVGETTGKDWRYIAEGALNIALRYVGSDSALQGKILRLRKLNPETSARSLVEAHTFVERVMLPLLTREFVPESHLVEISKKLLKDLDECIGDARPFHRRKHSLDLDARFGVLMRDQSRLACGCGKTEDEEGGCTSFAFEIKPKWGFLCKDSKYSVKRRVDRFTMHQQLKKHQAKLDQDDAQISSYNPLELYQGDALRALEQLESTPQNNFRLFINGTQRYPVVTSTGGPVGSMISVSSTHSLLAPLLVVPVKRSASTTSSVSSPTLTPIADRPTPTSSPHRHSRGLSALAAKTSSSVGVIPENDTVRLDAPSAVSAAAAAASHHHHRRVPSSEGNTHNILSMNSNKESPSPRRRRISYSDDLGENDLLHHRPSASPEKQVVFPAKGGLRISPSLESFASAVSMPAPTSSMLEALDDDEALRTRLLTGLAEILRTTQLLERVKSAQQLPPVTDIELVYPIFRRVPADLIKNLRLDRLDEAEDAFPSDLEIVRRFVVSCTARDCSLMITMSTCPRPKTKPAGRTRDGAFAFDLAVVDLDPKPVEKMTHYFETDRKIAELYEELERSGKLFI